MTKPKDDDGIYEVMSRGRIRFRFRVDVGTKPDGSRRQKMQTHDTWEQADAARKQIIADLAKGTHVSRDGTLTVAVFLNGQLRSLESTTTPGTIDVYRRCLSYVIADHGERALYDLKRDHVEQTRDAMLSGKARRIGSGPLSASVINTMLMLLTSMLDNAVDEQLVPRNVAKGVKRVEDRGHDKRIRASRGSWRRAHGKQLLDALAGYRLLALVVLSLLGLRRGEVLALKWDRDIDLDGSSDWAEDAGFTGVPCLRIEYARKKVRGRIVDDHTKTEASERTLPLPMIATMALKRWRIEQGRERLAAKPGAYRTEGHVFTDTTGKALHPDWYTEEWHKLAKRADLPDIPLHGARHWCASQLKQTVRAFGVQKAWLGHGKTGTTEGYQHVEPDELIDAADGLDWILSTGRSPGERGGLSAVSR